MQALPYIKMVEQHAYLRRLERKRARESGAGEMYDSNILLTMKCWSRTAKQAKLNELIDYEAHFCHHTYASLL